MYNAVMVSIQVRDVPEQVRDTLDIHFAMSSSAIAADEFVELLGSDAPDAPAGNNL